MRCKVAIMTSPFYPAECARLSEKFGMSTANLAAAKVRAEIEIRTRPTDGACLITAGRLN